MATKATHNGTCQVCGRLQAVSRWRIAKHGYTVKDGWFQGTCSGSRELPLEEDTTVLDATVGLLERRGPELMATTPDQVTVVTVHWDRRFGARGVSKGVEVHSQEEVDALDPPQWVACRTWAQLVDAEIWRRFRMGESMLAHAKTLVGLREARHGKPLVERIQKVKP